MCQKHQSQLVQSSLPCSTAFQFSSKVEVLIPFFYIILVLFCGQLGQQRRQFCKLSAFFFFVNEYKVWSSGRDPCVCQSPIGVYACHFLGQVLDYYYYYYYYYPSVFITPALADSFHWSLSDNQSTQVSWTLFSILGRS